MTSTLAIRVDPDLAHRVRERAAGEGRSVGGFVRATLAATLGDPAPRRRRAARVSEDVVTALRDGGRLAGSLVQAARALRETEHPAAHADAESLLRDVRRALQPLRQEP